VTHNHHRDDVVDLFRDAFRYFEGLDAHPERALCHIASPFAISYEIASAANGSLVPA
jgi:hypothetical protein